MAKKSTGRLAGLAALAAAAYMASKGKGEAKADTKADTKADASVDATPKKADDITVSGEGGFDAPADMSKVSRVGTPARTISSPSAPATKAPAIGGPTPTRAPGGVGKRGGVSVGTGSGGGRGAAAGEEAAYRASRDTGDAMSRRMKAENDGGKSVVDRQNAGAKNAGLSVGDYFTSGKAQIDKQDASGTAAKPTPVEIDETKLSLSDRMKLKRERARSDSAPTDYRSVNERFAGMKKGGAVKKMASGGMTSQRGDGIASKGKTRCKMY